MVFKLDYEAISKKCAQRALDEFLFNGKSIREWAEIIINHETAARRRHMRLIDADAIKDEIRTKDIMGGLNYEYYIDHAPTVEERQTGEWERHYIRPNVYKDLRWYCSACGNGCRYNDAFMFDYCPNCGARMVEPQERSE